MKKTIFKISLLFSALIILASCNEDDATGHSTLQVSSPSLSVALDFANTQTLIEEETSYGFTVSISEPQVVNVAVYLEQTEGTATNGDDYSMPASVVIPAGSTSASGTIDIHADDLVEETETATIKIATGLESNVQAINDQTVTFNLINLVEGDLMNSLSWSAPETYLLDGTEFDPTVLADLRLLVTDVPYTTILAGSDGAGFETYLLDGSSPDGDYYIVADWYSAYDLGSQGFFDLDLTVTFDQVGVINGQSYTFPAAMNSENSCSSVYFVLAQVTKTGESYEITPIGANSPVLAAPFVGTATVVVDDWADYAPGETVTIEAGANDNEFWIRSYDNPYIANPDTSYMIVTIDPATSEVTVASNEDFEYGCSEGDVVGTGFVNACEGTITLDLDFLLGNCGDYTGNSFILQL